MRFTRSRPSFPRLAALALLVSLGAATPALAQAAAVARTAAKEVLEALGRAGAKQGAEAAARDLAQFGGEAAVRQAVERVAAEAGEQSVPKLAALAERFGVDALRAFRAVPTTDLAPVLRAVDEFAAASPDLAPAALRALAREGEGPALSALTTRFGPDALEAAARHPGVGTTLVGKLGSEGASLGKTLTTDQAISVGRQATEMAALPPVERGGVVALLAKSPAKAAAFLDKHPRFFLIAGAGAILIANSDTLLNGTSDVVIGPDGKPRVVKQAGMLERAVLNPAMRWILPILAALLAIWGGMKTYWSWRGAALRHEIKDARAKV